MYLLNFEITQRYRQYEYIDYYGSGKGSFCVFIKRMKRESCKTQTGFIESSNTLQNLSAINIVTRVKAMDLGLYITLSQP
jgi:hypothetical protein